MYLPDGGFKGGVPPCRELMTLAQVGPTTALPLRGPCLPPVCRHGVTARGDTPLGPPVGYRTYKYTSAVQYCCPRTGTHNIYMSPSSTSCWFYRTKFCSIVCWYRRTSTSTSTSPRQVLQVLQVYNKYSTAVPVRVLVSTGHVSSRQGGTPPLDPPPSMYK